MTEPNVQVNYDQESLITLANFVVKPDRNENRIKKILSNFENMVT
jgi:hypothetical protein